MKRLLPLLILLVLALPLAAQSDSPCASIDPPDADAAYYIGLGNAYFSQANNAQAIIAYSCALEHDPNYAPAYVNRGLAHAAQFNGTQALADYDRALELDSGLLAAYNNRGLLYSQEANYSLALADFTLLTQTAPDYAPAFHNRAMVHAAEGSYDLAIADLQQAMALDPDYDAPYAALGAVYLAMANQQYAEYEQRTGRPAYYEAPDTLRTVQEAAQSDNPSVWFGLQTADRVGLS